MARIASCQAKGRPMQALVPFPWEEGTVSGLCHFSALPTEFCKSTYERFPGVGRQSVEGFFVHALGAESLDVWAIYLQGEKDQ